MIFKFLVGLLFLCYGVWSFPDHGLLGAKECTWGPSYWCKNLTAAKGCNAVSHCIQTVWVYKQVPEDKDDICGLCKKMVQDARDQLESNETVDEMKQVFEGSCKLLFLKPAVKLCIKLSDDAVPELVEMLSSQMNPDVVCSVSGLCNNAEIDKMIEDRNAKKAKEADRVKELNQHCPACLDFAEKLEEKIRKSTDDDLKMYLLERCRPLGSFSDSCSAIIISNFDVLRDRLKNHFTPRGFCHLTSSCIGNYSRQIQVKTESDIGVVQVNTDALSVSVKHLPEDQTCDLCKQLVKHLKDILVADTTEAEFRQVLEGLCKQTGKFKDECHSLVDQYYNEIYSFIVNDINGNEICSLAGICPGPGVYINGPIWPLLPEAPVPMNEKMTGNGEDYFKRVEVQKGELNVRTVTPSSPKKVKISFGDPLDPATAQLPLERFYTPQHKDLEVNNNQACVFCQYFLHYIQKVITQPYGENEIKRVVNKACDELPKSVNIQCKNFVEMYGDAFVAILAQEIDPSQVCPSIHLCPAQLLENRYEPLDVKGKPGCPLCLMAVEELIEKLKDNKTEESVKTALDNLCIKLPKSLQGQCMELVKKYTEDLVDMIMADLNPQEVCTLLKLCNVTLQVELVPTRKPERLHYDIMTNEIYQDDSTEFKSSVEGTSVCVLCEFVMEKIESRLVNNQTEDEIEQSINHICPMMPSTVRGDCERFVKKYSPVIAKLLVQLLDPKDICTAINLCAANEKSMHKQMLLSLHAAIDDCAVCEAVIGAVDAILEDKKIDRNLSKYASRLCSGLPMAKQDKCRMILQSYGPSIINLIVDFGVKPASVCARIELCDESQQAKVDMTEEKHEQPELLGGNRCTWGPSYWCQSEHHATACGTLAHCREVVWKADQPK